MKIQSTKNLNNQKIRFILVGVFNTGLDFIIYTVLVSIGLYPVISNYFSTFVSLVFSFILNKNYAFKDKNDTKTKSQFTLFILFTGISIWLIQPFIIYLLIDHVFDGNKTLLISLVAKSIATIFSMLFNYFTYDKIVFKKLDN